MASYGGGSNLQAEQWQEKVYATGTSIVNESPYLNAAQVLIAA